VLSRPAPSVGDEDDKRQTHHRLGQVDLRWLSNGHMYAAVVHESRERKVLEDFETRVLEKRGPQAVDVTDGRVANRLRNRDKVIDALVELVLEGKTGTVDEVVERSGVARRSIFRHFTDLSDMLLEAFRRVVANAVPLSLLPAPGVGLLDDRVAVFVDVRLRVLQMTHPFGIVARARLVEVEALRIGLVATTEMVRVQIANHFANELAERSAAEAERIVDAIYLVVSFEGFDVLVHQLGRPIEVVRVHWTEVIRRLLNP
jgi:AcrR family transcriptional regulator